MPIDPDAATNLVEFKELLTRLRRSRGEPSFKAMERAAGPGILSHTMAHRLVSPKWDLVTIRECERVVGAFVATLGENPGPWMEVVVRLLQEAKNPTAPPAPTWVPTSTRRPSTRAKVLIGVGICTVAMVATIVATAQIEDPPAVVTQVAHDEPVTVELGSGTLRVAIEDDTARLGVVAVVRNASAAGSASWLVTAPHRDNPNYHQLRHLDGGQELVCLEVRDKNLADDVPIQFSGCNGETHQYWNLQPTERGYLRITNLATGKCLSVAGAGQPQAGMHVIQRPCDDSRPAQQWKTTPSTAPTQSKAPVAGSLNPAELPRGGQDKPCDGLPVLAADTTAWTSEKHSVRQVSAPRGQAAIRPSAAYSELYFANTVNPATNTEETYYWAEGWAKFTPDRFRMYLQWTTVRGPGGWHTCEYDLPGQGTVKSAAIPRDSTPNKSRDVQFRLCMSYQPPLGDTVLECSADRY